MTALLSVQVVFKGTKPDEYEARKQVNSLGGVGRMPNLMKSLGIHCHPTGNSSVLVRIDIDRLFRQIAYMS